MEQTQDMVAHSPEQPTVETGDWTSQDIFNVYNPFFGIKASTDLHSINPSDMTWDPDNTPWVQSLTPEERVAIGSANSEEYAMEILDRRKVYQESQEKLASDPILTTVAGIGASFVDPSMLIPTVGVGSKVKAAYTLQAKALSLTKTVGASAAFGIGANTFYQGAFSGQGLDREDYGTSNLYAGLLAGGLPLLASALSTGYTSHKIAKGLTSDPKNYSYVLGEVTAEQLGGARLRDAYSSFAPDWLKSDIVLTTSSANPEIVAFASRIDSPPIALVDEAGNPVPIGTTGQDYKIDFNGKTRMTLADVKGLFTESGYKSEDDFLLDVGRVLRNRTTEQEQLVYKDVTDEIKKIREESNTLLKEELDKAQMDVWEYRDTDGTWRPATEEDIKLAEGPTQEIDTPVSTRLPRSFGTPSPKYWGETIEFEDDLTKALYIAGSSGAKRGQYRDWVKTVTDLTDDEIDEIYSRIKSEITASSRGSEIKIESIADALPIKTTKTKIGKGSDRLRLKSKNKKELAKIEEELKTKIQEETDARIQKVLDESYERNQVEFKHSNPKVVEAAQRVDDYYKYVLDEGKRLKIHELRKVTPNRHYMTRIFDFPKIREISTPELESKLYKALKGHVANSDLKEEELIQSAKDIAKKLKDLDYDRNFADFSFFVPKELGVTAYIRNRKYRFDDRVLEDILVTKIDDSLGQYSYAQGGHYAANHAFPEIQGVPREEQKDKFLELVKKIRDTTDAKDPRVAKELSALENMYEDMLGTLRIPKDAQSATWKATRIMNSMNSISFGGGFMLNTASELGNLLLDGAVSNVMKTRLSALKEINHMFTGKTIKDPFIRDLINMGQLENLMEYHGMQKYSDTDTVFNVGRVEQTLNEATSEFFKYTGLRGATVALEAISGSKVVADLLDYGSKKTLSMSQKKYLARIGLTHEDAIAITKKMKEVGEFVDGKVYDMHLDKFDGELLDKLTTGINRAVRHTVIRGDTTYLPSFVLKPTPFRRAFFQFLRYPLAATETLLARGLDENMAKWTAATMTSTFLMASVMYLRETAAVEAGLLPKSEANFQDFWEDDQAASKLFTASLSKAGVLGGASIFAEKFSAVSGVPMPGSEYVNKDVASAILGPTFSRLPQMRNILEPMFTEGVIDDRKQWTAMKALVPGATVPFINEGLSTLIKENTY